VRKVRSENPGAASERGDFISKGFGFGGRMSMMEDEVCTGTSTSESE
jgi:hypothetical protein